MRDRRTVQYHELMCAGQSRMREAGLWHEQMRVCGKRLPSKLPSDRATCLVALQNRIAGRLRLCWPTVVGAPRTLPPSVAKTTSSPPEAVHCGSSTDIAVSGPSVPPRPAAMFKRLHTHNDIWHRYSTPAPSHRIDEGAVRRAWLHTALVQHMHSGSVCA